MKGFIELTLEEDNKKFSVSVSRIEMFAENMICLAGFHARVKESYEEIKAKIEEVTK